MSSFSLRMQDDGDEQMKENVQWPLPLTPPNGFTSLPSVSPLLVASKKAASGEDNPDPMNIFSERSKRLHSPIRMSSSNPLAIPAGGKVLPSSYKRPMKGRSRAATESYISNTAHMAGLALRLSCEVDLEDDEMLGKEQPLPRNRFSSTLSGDRFQSKFSSSLPIDFSSQGLPHNKLQLYPRSETGFIPSFAIDSLSKEETTGFVQTRQPIASNPFEYSSNLNLNTHKRRAEDSRASSPSLSLASPFGVTSEPSHFREELFRLDVENTEAEAFTKVHHQLRQGIVERGPRVPPSTRDNSPGGSGDFSKSLSNLSLSELHLQLHDRLVPGSPWNPDQLLQNDSRGRSMKRRCQTDSSNHPRGARMGTEMERRGNHLHPPTEVAERKGLALRATTERQRSSASHSFESSKLNPSPFDRSLVHQSASNSTDKTSVRVETRDALDSDRLRDENRNAEEVSFQGKSMLGEEVNFKTPSTANSWFQGMNPRASSSSMEESCFLEAVLNLIPRSHSPSDTETDSDDERHDLEMEIEGRIETHDPALSSSLVNSSGNRSDSNCVSVQTDTSMSHVTPSRSSSRSSTPLSSIAGSVLDLPFGSVSENVDFPLLYRLRCLDAFFFKAIPILQSDNMEELGIRINEKEMLLKSLQPGSTLTVSLSNFESIETVEQSKPTFIYSYEIDSNRPISAAVESSGRFPVSRTRKNETRSTSGFKNGAFSSRSSGSNSLIRSMKKDAIASKVSSGRRTFIAPSGRGARRPVDSKAKIGVSSGSSGDANASAPMPTVVRFKLPSEVENRYVSCFKSEDGFGICKSDLTSVTALRLKALGVSSKDKARSKEEMQVLVQSLPKELRVI